jgi:hypothetical protein
MWSICFIVTINTRDWSIGRLFCKMWRVWVTKTLGIDMMSTVWFLGWVLVPSAAQAFALYRDRNRPLRKPRGDWIGRCLSRFWDPDFRSVAMRSRLWNEREVDDGRDGRWLTGSRGSVHALIGWLLMCKRRAEAWLTTHFMWYLLALDDWIFTYALDLTQGAKSDPYL